jgi:hypothetical protein
MDPMMFATIVGLLFSFQSGRESVKLQDFLEWMNQRHHKDLVRLIEQNNDLKSGLTVLMNRNHNEVMSQLSQLNDLMMSVSNQIEGLDTVAKVFQKNEGLSEQAIDVLRQFVNSSGDSIVVSKTIGDDKPYQIDGARLIDFEEPRFIEDDFDNLVENGLIKSEIDGSGYQWYKITRKAIRFIELIDNS